MTQRDLGGMLERIAKQLLSLEQKVDALTKADVMRATTALKTPRSVPAEELRPAVLTYAAAAQQLSISKAKLKRMIAKGQIASRDVGDGKGIPADEVARIAAGKPVPASLPRRASRAKAPRGSAERTKIRAALREARSKQG